MSCDCASLYGEDEYGYCFSAETCAECWKKMGVCTCGPHGQCLLCEEKPPSVPPAETIAELTTGIISAHATATAAATEAAAVWKSKHGDVCAGHYLCACSRCAYRRVESDFVEEHCAVLELLDWYALQKANDPRHRNGAIWSDHDVCSLAYAAAKK